MSLWKVLEGLDVAAAYVWLTEIARPALEVTAMLALTVGVIVVTLLARAAAQARRRIDVLGAEVARLQMQLLGVERLQYEADQKAARDEARLGQLERAQRRAVGALERPDARLALALARAGADERALVDCGLSHAESHLARALDTARHGSRRETEPCVLSSDHEH